MAEPESTPFAENTPQQVLRRVGLTPEDLRGQDVLFFGNDSDKLSGRVEGAQITDGSIDMYVATDELSPTPVDRVIGIGNEDFRDDVGTEGMQLIGEAVRILKPNGDIRIATPRVYPDDKSRERAETHFEMSLLGADADTKVNIVTNSSGQSSYVVIRPR